MRNNLFSVVAGTARKRSTQESHDGRPACGPSLLYAYWHITIIQCPAQIPLPLWTLSLSFPEIALFFEKVLACSLIGCRLYPASNATYSFALRISFSLQNSWKIGKYFFIAVASKSLRPREVSAFLDLLAASLLSFQLSNKMSIFVADDDESDNHDFMRETFFCCSLMDDVVLWGLKNGNVN